MIKGAEKESIRQMLLSSGAAFVGFSDAQNIPEDVNSQFQTWVKSGNNAQMDYLERHIALRKDINNILCDTKTVISLAFPYAPPTLRSPQLPRIARYAYGKDYHKTLKKRIRPLCNTLAEKYHVETRICTDSAPIAERFFALNSGIGCRGLNGTVIVPRYGSYIFLAEILTTLEIEPDTPSSETCLKCNACINACPGQALYGDGTLDARKCLSYITIEHTGPLTTQQQALLNTPLGKETIYGCDICQEVCPHNKHTTPTPLTEFHATASFLNAKTLEEAYQPGSPILRAIKRRKS